MRSVSVERQQPNQAATVGRKGPPALHKRLKLDIVEIADLETQGFEAALLTDDVKSQGAILVAKGQSRARRRFSIAHELGHFFDAEPHAAGLRAVPLFSPAAALDDHQGSGS